MPQRTVGPLLHDETFGRLCRSKDLLATSYDAQVSLDQAAREACLSAFHFHRLFTSAFGETPHDYLTRLRMEHAKRLLALGEMSVTEICMEVGYSSLGSFIHKFPSIAGRTPTDYHPNIPHAIHYTPP